MTASRMSFCLILMGTLAASVPANADLVITGATLTGPDCIDEGGTATYFYTVTGTGAGALGTTTYVTIFDQDPLDDDELYNEVQFVITGDDKGNFTQAFEFTLECRNGIIFGNGVSTGESEAEIGGFLEDFFGNDYANSFSNILSVSCCKAVPEPTSLAMLGVGGLGAMRLIRRKRALQG